MHKIGTLRPSEVDEEEIKALDSLLNDMADKAEDRREGDLIEFLTAMSESLKQGNTVTLYST